jgi:uracil-DNA glycosylase
MTDHSFPQSTIMPEPSKSPFYDSSCRRCPRLADFLDAVAADHPSYWCKPVPPFGDPAAKLVIVGLAPGMHGANASGRPFTGDYAGILLYQTLHDYGFGSLAQSTSRDDVLTLLNCRITNAVKCLPPQNKPMPIEIGTCNAYLGVELATLPRGAAVLALGRIAHDASLRALGDAPAKFKFAHGARHSLRNRAVLFDSYHCSRYNTNTRRLTTQMFRDVFDAIAAHLAASNAT